MEETEPLNTLSNQLRLPELQAMTHRITTGITIGIYSE
jgi:hypothetical protein